MKRDSRLTEGEVDRPDWKQWLPIYGRDQVKKDSSRGRPTILDGRGLVTHRMYEGYHATSCIVLAAVAAYGVSSLIEKLF